MNLRLSIALGLVAALSAARASALPLKQVEVIGARIHVSDILPDLTGTAASLDLGPTPQAGGSRLVTRKDVTAAFDREHVAVPAAFPEAVRVVRKVKRLETWDIDAAVRTALAQKPLRHGVVLAMVNAERAVDVADGYAHVDIEVPRVPKKAGGFSTAAVLSFVDSDEQILNRISVPIVLAVSDEGAAYDAPHGSAVTLVIRRNLVEVRIPGVATIDADIGDPVPVQIHSSGRVMHARLSSRDEALATELPQ